MSNSSMADLLSIGGHSAIVNMRLQVNGSTIRILQMGHDFLFLESPIDHLPTDASIVMQIDDSEKCWDVRLPDGISAHSERVTISKI